MATGNTMFHLVHENGHAPSANGATFDTIQDGSTPNLVHSVIDYDGGTNVHYDWFLPIPDAYDGGGFAFQYKYATSGADPDLVDMEFRMMKLVDLDILTADLLMDGQTAVSIQDTPPGTPTNKFSVSDVGNLSHSDADSPAVKDVAWIRGTRDTAAAANADDLQMLEVYVNEQ